MVNQFVSPSKAGPVLTSAQEVRVRLSGENFTGKWWEIAISSKISSVAKYRWDKGSSGAHDSEHDTVSENFPTYGGLDIFRAAYRQEIAISTVES